VGPTLETERLRLRPFVARDADAYAPIVGDGEVMRFIGNGRPTPREEVPELLERYAARWESDGFSHFAVERQEDGALLGRAGFVFWDTDTWTVGSRAELGDDSQIELGWLLGRAAWGHGYATEAATAARAFARERGVTRLISLIHPDNVRSQALAQRLGARVERRIETSRWGPADVWLHPG
jgi:RimJ/RimL family protein N-acetyltransferase